MSGNIFKVAPAVELVGEFISIGEIYLIKYSMIHRMNKFNYIADSQHQQRLKLVKETPDEFDQFCILIHLENGGTEIVSCCNEKHRDTLFYNIKIALCKMEARIRFNK